MTSIQFFDAAGKHMNERWHKDRSENGLQPTISEREGWADLLI